MRSPHRQLVSECDVIFTCTPSRAPLLREAHLLARPANAPGLHITALGADQPGKQELVRSGASSPRPPGCCGLMAAP